jgi:hypothetical protein
VGALGTLDGAAEFGGAGRQHEELPAVLRASVREGGEFAAAIDLQGAHREGHALEERLEELRGDARGGAAVGLEDVPARILASQRQDPLGQARRLGGLTPPVRTRRTVFKAPQVAGIIPTLPAIEGLAADPEVAAGQGGLAPMCAVVIEPAQSQPNFLTYLNRAPLQVLGAGHHRPDLHGNTLPQSVTNHSEREHARRLEKRLSQRTRSEREAATSRGVEFR